MVTTERQTTGWGLRNGDAVPASEEELRRNMEGLDPQLERIKWPSAGSTLFEVPGVDTGSRSIEGVVVHHRRTRSYWYSRQITNDAPDCSSQDGVRGLGDPGGDCAACPQNAWGSGKDQEGRATRGKACAEKMALYILRAGDSVPLVLQVPPASLKSYTDYMTLLTRRRMALQTVVTRVSLRAEKGDSGPYAVGVFECLGQLDDEGLVEAGAVGAMFGSPALQSASERPALTAGNGNGASAVSAPPAPPVPQEPSKRLQDRYEVSGEVAEHPVLKYSASGNPITGARLRRQRQDGSVSEFAVYGENQMAENMNQWNPGDLVTLVCHERRRSDDEPLSFVDEIKEYAAVAPLIPDEKEPVAAAPTNARGLPDIDPNDLPF